MTMQSEQIDKLAEALAKAQGAITSPPRNREVSVKGETKSGKEFTYTFKYATLDGIIDHVRGPLTANGLWFTQTLANGDSKYRLITRVIHSSGQWLASETPLFIKPNKFGEVTNQEFGSALTYMKRYALAAMLGIAADEDDDANAADGNTIEASKERKPLRTLKEAEAPPVELPDALRIRATEIASAIKLATTPEKKRHILELNREDVAELDKIHTRYGDRLRELANIKKEAA